jgi:8-oxo-dGTP pyrophosphatase MutT (NUDIX family)
VTASRQVPPALEARDAATVLLVRDAPEFEVFMLRRNLDSVWIAGASVFPGGAVDDADRHPDWERRCAGWDDAGASRALGVPAGGLGFLVGAVRETFEEAGVLLARDPDGGVVDARSAHFVAARAALNAGAEDFGTFADAHGLSLATDELHVFSHWITPPGGPRRYNTWFFLASAPPGSYEHDDTELIASRWVRPVDALRAAERGEIDLIFPTRKNLEMLARFDRAREVVDAARAAAASGAAGGVPLVVDSGDGRRIVLPGDAEPTGSVPCPT